MEASIEALLNSDAKRMKEWLFSLPSFIDNGLGKISCYHGSPQNFLEDYVYPDSPLEMFLKHQSSTFLLGHTHYPMARRIKDKLVVNPGSLGQPRNDRWPTYAVVDCVSETATFRQVFYDKEELIARIDQMGDVNPYLKRVLIR